MTTFVLKKYEPAPEPNTEKAADGAGAKPAEPEEKSIEVTSSDAISKIVAQALYKAMPNVEIVQKENAEDADNEKGAAVVSTEEINQDPVAALKALGTHKCVLILSSKFSTAKEEWFLQTLENRGIKPFYTVSSFVRHVQSVLG